MRRPALTILTRARKRSSDSENQPIALLRSDARHEEAGDDRGDFSDTSQADYRDRAKSSAVLPHRVR